MLLFYIFFLTGYFFRITKARLFQQLHTYQIQVFIFKVFRNNCCGFLIFSKLSCIVCVFCLFVKSGFKENYLVLLLSCSDMIFHMNYLLLFKIVHFLFFNVQLALSMHCKKTREMKIDCWKFLKVKSQQKRKFLKETKKFRNLC